MDKHFMHSFFHLFVVVPLFLYVGYMRHQTAPWLHTGLLTVGAILVVYHAFRGLSRWKVYSPSVWINAIHVLAVGPLLMYMGYYGKDTPGWCYEILLILGFGALGYHLFQVIRLLQTMPEVEIFGGEEKEQKKMEVSSWYGFATRQRLN